MLRRKPAWSISHTAPSVLSKPMGVNGGLPLRSLVTRVSSAVSFSGLTSRNVTRCRGSAVAIGIMNASRMEASAQDRLHRCTAFELPQDGRWVQTLHQPIHCDQLRLLSA